MFNYSGASYLLMQIHRTFNNHVDLATTSSSLKELTLLLAAPELQRRQRAMLALRRKQTMIFMLELGNSEYFVVLFYL